jgi:hypothetical protein
MAVKSTTRIKQEKIVQSSINAFTDLKVARSKAPTLFSYWL